jgi:hypothetical protein
VRGRSRSPRVHRHHCLRRPQRAPSTSPSRSPNPSVRGPVAARLLRLSRLLGPRYRKATHAMTPSRRPSRRDRMRGEPVVRCATEDVLCQARRRLAGRAAGLADVGLRQDALCQSPRVR